MRTVFAPCLFALALLAPTSLPQGRTGLRAQQTPLERFDFQEPHFGGIPVELTLWVASGAEARKAAAAAFARVKELERMMSDYALDPPSSLNRIAAEAPAPVVVPGELLAALARAKELHGLTGGAFDVTAKPFVQLWRVSRRLGELPPTAALRRARRFVDISALRLDREASTARLVRKGMWLDLGGMAKGLIGDEVVALLRARGITRCRYAAGGDMVFGEPPPGEDGWRVVVADLLVSGSGGDPEPLTFRIADGAASVSGDVFRFVTIDGVRYAHVIDPRTGLGVTERRIACVRGPRGVDTDPLATAGLVLDDEAWQAALGEVPGCVGTAARVGVIR